MDCDCVRLNWVCYGDNNVIDKKYVSVLETFTEPAAINCIFNDTLPTGVTENMHTKYIVRKTWKNTSLGIHFPQIQFGIVHNAAGDIVKNDSAFLPINYTNGCVKHFITKSTKDYIERRFGTYDACGVKRDDLEKLKRFYFNLNNQDKQKEELFNKFIKGGK